MNFAPPEFRNSYENREELTMSQQGPEVLSEVRAKSFVLVNDQGNFCAAIKGASDGGITLQLKEEEKEGERIRIVRRETGFEVHLPDPQNGNALVLGHERRNENAFFWIGHDKAKAVFINFRKSDLIKFGLRGGARGPEISFTMRDINVARKSWVMPEIKITDNNGRQRIIVGLNEQFAPIVNLENESGRTSLSFGCGENTLGFSLHDKEGKHQVMASYHEGNQFQLEVRAGERWRSYVLQCTDEGEILLSEHTSGEPE